MNSIFSLFLNLVSDITIICYFVKIRNTTLRAAVQIKMPAQKSPPRNEVRFHSNDEEPKKEVKAKTQPRRSTAGDDSKGGDRFSDPSETYGTNLNTAPYVENDNQMDNQMISDALYDLKTKRDHIKANLFDDISLSEYEGYHMRNIKNYR
ncbi:hypothetical protein RF11_00910 [Thelohanellus kitauei]|uniref:Uncharacterized protein n=1 Tax=Thelohanellus kitauei TaxID=669202 RepID=A0A0C2IJJ3_THEKT|nr:hypothetical protein RF11_00910 [Thelohanellus kitauei]